MKSDEQPAENYHTYESNPVPWWLALLWAGYFLFSVTYLVINISPGLIGAVTQTGDGLPSGGLP